MFHKEGFKIIIITFLLTSVLCIFAEYFIENDILSKFLQIVFLLILILILQFFRNPKRITELNENNIIAPADGKIVIIKEVYEEEYFKEKKNTSLYFYVSIKCSCYSISNEWKSCF